MMNRHMRGLFQFEEGRVVFCLRFFWRQCILFFAEGSSAGFLKMPAGDFLLCLMIDTSWISLAEGSIYRGTEVRCGRA